MRVLVAIAALSLAGSLWPLQGTTARFLRDDPLQREPETQDAGSAEPYDIDLFADLLINMFSNPGEGSIGTRAQNINTVDEVPDSNWFTNRILARPVTPEEMRRGPNTGEGPAPGTWTVIRPKTAGFAPGFTVRDARGVVWFLTFDPRGQPNAATAAIAVACRLFWALGYYQVESYLATLDVGHLAVSEDASMNFPSGYRRAMTMDDVRSVLEKSAQKPDGTYRVLAARAVPGRVLGGFRYHGTRPDDPNDVVPHEHRRELRALKVFGAWTNLVDMKAGNTLDTVVEQDGRRVVRHYLQDVGSTFGTGAQGPREWDEGWEYLFESDPLWKRLVSLGFYRRPWQTARYEEAPEIGRFEGDTFDPETWRSRVPAAAVLYATDEDAFWAARRVAAFSDELIRIAVDAGEYEDPASARLLAEVLMKRRDRIARAYLPKVNPLTDFALSSDGTLTFDNAAVRHGTADPPAGGYRIVWLRFNNATGETTALGAPATAGSTHTPVAAAIRDAAGGYLQASITAVGAAHPAWERPVLVTFRRHGTGWTLVGVERSR